MKTKIIKSADNAYDYPLLIKSLLLSGQRYEPDREIVYRDQVRYNYVTLNERIRRLANVLSEAGVEAGDTVAVLDWDSHRYLEAYFAVPMIGAILHHVNIRLSPDQIRYTMNHAEDKLLIVNDDFLELAEQLAPGVDTVEGIIRISEFDQPRDTMLGSLVKGEYEALMAEASTDYDFPDFDENSVATHHPMNETVGVLLCEEDQHQDHHVVDVAVVLVLRVVASSLDDQRI